MGLKEKFGDDLQILAFPCNQFGAQEPGSNEEIKSFASSYGANFKLFDKVDVRSIASSPPPLLPHRLALCALSTPLLSSYIKAFWKQVNGDSASPLYEWLRKSTDGTDIRWNFEVRRAQGLRLIPTSLVYLIPRFLWQKFLIGKDGKVAKRAGPKRTPESLQEDTQSLL